VLAGTPAWVGDGVFKCVCSLPSTSFPHRAASPAPLPPLCSQLGTHLRGKRKREELAGLMRKARK